MVCCHIAEKICLGDRCHIAENHRCHIAENFLPCHIAEKRGDIRGRGVSARGAMSGHSSGGEWFLDRQRGISPLSSPAHVWEVRYEETRTYSV